MNLPIFNCARRLKAGTEVNPRAVKSASMMYKAARQVLAAHISFSPEEALLKAEARLKDLEAKRDRQIEGASCAAQSMQAADRAVSRIISLYSAELKEIEDEITQLKNERAH